MRISAFGIAALFFNLNTGCLLGAEPPGKPGDADDTGDTGDMDTSSDSAEVYPVQTQVTLREGHYFVNQTEDWTEFWLDDDGDDDVVIQGGDPDNSGWFFLNVVNSAYGVEYTIDSGYRVDLDCEDESYTYCWNEGSAVLEAFGVSSYPQ